MNSYEFRMKYIQLPVRIKELKGLGYNIISKPKPNRSVNYVLLSPKVVSSLGEQILEPNPWEENLVRVEKNGRVFWESKKEPKQLDISFK